MKLKHFSRVIENTATTIGGGSLHIRYVNRRFTYLLTYLLTALAIIIYCVE